MSRVRATSPSVIPHAAPWAPTATHRRVHPHALYCSSGLFMSVLSVHGCRVLMPAGVALTNSVVLTLVYDIYMYSPHTRIFTRSSQRIMSRTAPLLGII